MLTVRTRLETLESVVIAPEGEIMWQRYATVAEARAGHARLEIWVAAYGHHWPAAAATPRVWHGVSQTVHAEHAAVAREAGARERRQARAMTIRHRGIPQGRGSLSADRVALGAETRRGRRRDLSLLVMALRARGASAPLADAQMLIAAGLHAVGGMVGIAWATPETGWATTAQRPFRVAWVLLDTLRGAEELHRGLRRQGCVVAPASRIRPLAVLVDGEHVAGWAVPVALKAAPDRAERWGYWDAPVRRRQHGYWEAKRRAEAWGEREDREAREEAGLVTRRRDGEAEIGDREEEATDFLFVARGRGDEAAWDEDPAEQGREPLSAAARQELAALEQEVFDVQWPLHDIDFRDDREYAAWRNAVQAEKRAAKAEGRKPVRLDKPAYAAYAKARVAAQAAKRPGPVHPTVEHARRVQAALAHPLAQQALAAGDDRADLAWVARRHDEGRDVPARATRVALLWKGCGPKELREAARHAAVQERAMLLDLAEATLAEELAAASGAAQAEGRRARRTAQAKALADLAAVESVAVAEALHAAPVRRLRRVAALPLGRLGTGRARRARVWDAVAAAGPAA